MRPIITTIPSNLVCSNGPYRSHGPAVDPLCRPAGYQPPIIEWETLRDEHDQRPTLAEAIDAHSAATGLSLRALCLQAHIRDAHAYTARACGYVPGLHMRARLAAMVGMQPEQIRWPVTVREGH